MRWEKPYKIFLTRRVNDDIADSESMAKAVTAAFRRFNNFDYGKVSPEDENANNSDLTARCGHVLGRYDTPNGDIYINLVFDYPDIGDYALAMYPDEY